MVTRLKQDGNGFALPVDSTMLEKLQIDSETPLEVSTDGEKLIVQPIKDPKRRAEFQQIIADMNRHYEPMFKRLAE